MLATLVATVAGPVARDEPPRDVGLVERAGSRLVQLDVSVRGPQAAVEALDADSFRLVVGGRPIERFVVDRVCRDPVVVAPTAADPAAAAAAAVAPVTYVFYVDQPMLTMAGRQETIATLRDLIPRLFQDARTQAMLVYNGRSLEVVVDMTSDPAALLAGVDRIDRERKNWESYAMEEFSRVDAVSQTLRQFGTDAALAEARRFQQEEAWFVEKALRRLSMTLGRLAEQDQPKAVVYFADILRRNPGEHYLSLFPSLLVQPTETQGNNTAMQTSALLTGASFDRIVDEASALGIRFYTVQAEGLRAETQSMRRGAPTATSTLAITRIRDAQDALDSVGLETGGTSFLNGVPPAKIARRLVEDLRCMLLVSFDPGDLPQDEPLPVRLTTAVPKITLQTRGRLIVQSDAERRRSRLLAAFATASPDVEAGAASAIRGRVIPTDYRDGAWSALVQVWLPGSDVRTATWDLGASLLARGRVREDFSARLRPTAAGARVVLEREARFPPGPYELVAVAHEISTDQVFSRRIDGDWPDPDATPAAVGPIAVLQPEVGAFVRDDEARTRGALALGDDDPVHADRPTALIAVVCRARGNRNELTVARSLSGENAVPFDAATLPADERCMQLRDGVPAGTMTAGELEYRVRVLEGETEIASGSARLRVVGADGDTR